MSINCTLYKNREPIAEIGPDVAFFTMEYESNACYNLACETTAAVEYIIFHYGDRGYHLSEKPPHYLYGLTGCRQFSSCETAYVDVVAYVGDNIEYPAARKTIALGCAVESRPNPKDGCPCFDAEEVAGLSLTSVVTRLLSSSSSEEIFLTGAQEDGTSVSYRMQPYRQCRRDSSIRSRMINRFLSWNEYETCKALLLEPIAEYLRQEIAESQSDRGDELSCPCWGDDGPSTDYSSSGANGYTCNTSIQKETGMESAYFSHLDGWSSIFPTYKDDYYYCTKDSLGGYANSACRYDILAECYSGLLDHFGYSGPDLEVEEPDQVEVPTDPPTQAPVESLGLPDPENTVDHRLSCKLLKVKLGPNNQREGMEEIAVIGPDTDEYTVEFDPTGCYNVYCAAGDESIKSVHFTYGNGQQHESRDPPFYLNGLGGCKKISPDECNASAAKIHIEARFGNDAMVGSEKTIRFICPDGSNGTMLPQNNTGLLPSNWSPVPHCPCFSTNRVSAAQVDSFYTKFFRDEEYEVSFSAGRGYFLREASSEFTCNGNTFYKSSANELDVCKTILASKLSAAYENEIAGAIALREDKVCPCWVDDRTSPVNLPPFLDKSFVPSCSMRTMSSAFLPMTSNLVLYAPPEAIISSSGQWTSGDTVCQRKDAFSGYSPPLAVSEAEKAACYVDILESCYAGFTDYFQF